MSMKRLFLVLAMLAALMSSHPRYATAAGDFSPGDTTLAPGATIKLYPCFCFGGSHIHSGLYASRDECQRGDAYVSIFSLGASVRIQFFGKANVDTSGVTCPSGSTFQNLTAAVDSVLVTSTGTASTRLLWSFTRGSGQAAGIVPPGSQPALDASNVMSTHEAYPPNLQIDSKTLCSSCSVAANTWYCDSTNTNHGLVYDKGNIYRRKSVTIAWSVAPGVGAVNDSSFVVRPLVSWDGVTFTPLMERRQPTVGTTYVAPSMQAEKQLAPDTLQYVVRPTDLTSGDFRNGQSFRLRWNGDDIDAPYIRMGILNRSSQAVTYSIIINGVGSW